MATVLALEKLYTDVIARFAADGDSIPVRFGWREPAAHGDPPTHIEIVPGDDESGDFGAMQPPKYPGRNPRPLWTPRELFTVYVSGFDATAPENEFAQWKATRLVFDKFARAIYLAAYGTVSFDRTRYITKKTQRRFGVTMRIVGAILAMTPDSANTGAPADVKARVTATELDVVETFDVLPAT
jgi:hypothetical protein